MSKKEEVNKAKVNLEDLKPKKARRGRPPKVKWLKDGVYIELVEPRIKIKEQAVILFSQKGFYGASIREIADAAGVTKPVIYYHYASKEGLYKSIMLDAIQEILLLVEKAASNIQKACPSVILKNISREFFRWCTLNRNKASLFIYLITKHDPAFASICDKFLKGYNKILLPVMEKGVQTGDLSFKDIELANTAFLSLMTGFELLSTATGKNWTRPKYAGKAVDILLGNCK